MNDKTPDFINTPDYMAFMQEQQLAAASQRAILEMLSNNPNPSGTLILNMPRQAGKATTLRVLKEMFEKIEHENTCLPAQSRLDFEFGFEINPIHE